MRKTNTLLSYLTKYKANFLSKAFKQTKAGPRCLGTPFLVIYKVNIMTSHYKKSIAKSMYWWPYAMIS